MLTIDQVLELAKAGFEKEEIMKFMDVQPEDVQPEPEEAAPEPQQEEQQEAEDTVSRSEFDALKSAMQDLTKAIQANNILTASKETPEKKLTVDEAADAAIRAFFNS